ncbi:MAG: hypothetical protein KDA77_15080, partial [Planctomycetaceae bacterium]|nr:hypothetical protein [Planctomycetaceae bacterium]
MNSGQTEKPAHQQSETAVPSDRLRFWLLKPLILILSAAWFLALMIRLTVRDAGGLGPTLVFYVSPLILLNLGAIIVFVLSWYVRWHRIALVWFFLTLLTGIWCWKTQFERHDTSQNISVAKQPVLRVLFWNIGDRIWGIERVLDELRTVDADLIGLVEAGADTSKMKSFWKESFPDHPYQVVKEGFVFLSRVPISKPTSGALAQMGKYE